MPHVNSAKVVREDIWLQNGMLHVTDGVLDCGAMSTESVTVSASGDGDVKGIGVPFGQYLATSVSSVGMVAAAAQVSGGFDVGDTGKGVSGRRVHCGKTGWR